MYGGVNLLNVDVAILNLKVHLLVTTEVQSETSSVQAMSVQMSVV
jgi:hypothetical protein